MLFLFCFLVECISFFLFVRWVNKEHFAVWADGEHWSAGWQVAYSLLSELALSHMQRDTHWNTHLCTHSAAALSPNWYPEGFDGERQKDGVWKRKWGSKPPTSWSAFYLQSTEFRFNVEFHWMKNGQNYMNQVSKHELLPEIIVGATVTLPFVKCLHHICSKMCCNLILMIYVVYYMKDKIIWDYYIL